MLASLLKNMISQIQYMGRGDAEDEPARPNWAVISIHDSRLGPAKLKDGWFDILRLNFYDRENEVPGLPTFTIKQAQETVTFLEHVCPKIDGIIIHCHAGLSRSPAIAKFIAQKYGIDFDHKSSQYNKMVFNTLKQIDA